MNSYEVTFFVRDGNQPIKIVFNSEDEINIIEESLRKHLEPKHGIFCFAGLNYDIDEISGFYIAPGSEIKT